MSVVQITASVAPEFIGGSLNMRSEWVLNCDFIQGGCYNAAPWKLPNYSMILTTRNAQP